MCESKYISTLPRSDSSNVNKDLKNTKKVNQFGTVVVFFNFSRFHKISHTSKWKHGIHAKL